ncbi:hypothetical protein DTO271G3_5525 [Paecilomyces variotii]|nr:hypothetical protein DTO271G3_5525 [Paecilomyces variotii]
MFSVRTAFRAANSISARTGLRSAAPIRRSPASLVASAPARRSYHEKVIDHYSNPRNAGSLNRKDPNVGSGLVGAPACGDVIRLDIQVDEKTGNITEARFKTFGCGSAIASSSYLTTLLKGKSLEEAAKIKNTDISTELCLPPVKLHCSLLAEDAIKAALKDYESKRAGAATTNLAGTAKAFDKEPVAQATAQA